MQLSANGLNLIKGFEGLMLKAYPDGGGYSIGYGHHGVAAGAVIDRAEADRLFAQDVARFELAVNLGTQGAVTQNQFDAFTSLAYNIGSGAFSSSTALRKHNMGDYAGAADAILMFNKSQGAVHPGLVERRAREREVYLHGFGAYQQPNVSPVEPWPPAPAVSVPSSGPSITLGAGLLFFCPSCGGRSASVGIEVVEP